MTTPHVYVAINGVMASLAKDGISKDRSNQQQGYKFRGIDDVYNALTGALVENKLCMLPRVVSRGQVERQTMKGGNLFYTTVEMQFELVSAVDGTSHMVSAYGEAMDSADKSTNKAQSAAYKYAAMQAFCIPTEGDNDADATTHEVAPRPAFPTGQHKNKTALDTAITAFCTHIAALTTSDDLEAAVDEAKPTLSQYRQAYGKDSDHMAAITKQLASARQRVASREGLPNDSEPVPIEAAHVWSEVVTRLVTEIGNRETSPSLEKYIAEKTPLLKSLDTIEQAYVRGQIADRRKAVEAMALATAG